MDIPKGVRQVDITKIGNQEGAYTDEVSIEEPLEIVAVFQSKTGHEERIPVSVTMRTPGDDLDLSVGFLFSEGFVVNIADILKTEMKHDCAPGEEQNQVILIYLRNSLRERFENLNRHFYASSSCGVCGKTSVDLALKHCIYIPKKYAPSVNFSLLNSLVEKLRRAQTQFNRTGGLHACALFTSDGDLVHFAEDVGRHNAMDKLVGYLLRTHQIPADNHVLLLSGRASFEMVQKAASVGCSIIAAIGAPSSLAVEICKTHGITLIGFLRNGSANVYAGVQRIIRPQLKI